MKQFIVGSGWKMVKTYQDSIDTARELEKRLEGFHEFPVVIFPSFPAIPEICRKLSKESALKIGGQDLFWRMKELIREKFPGRCFWRSVVNMWKSTIRNEENIYMKIMRWRTGN